MHGLPCQRGSVIVLVLVFIVLLSFIVVAFLEEATAKVKYYGLFHNRDDLRVDAYSALEISLAVINEYREVEGALWAPAQGWGNPLEQAGFTPAHAERVTVSFADEAGRLPLASLDYDGLLDLFSVLGFDLPQAEELADGLLDWTDEDDLRRLNGFDGDDYEDRTPPYKAANAPIQSWDTFRLIHPFDTYFWDEDGRPLPQWAEFKSSVSLYHTGAVNLNQAPPVVRAWLEERGILYSAGLDDYINGRDGESGTEDDRIWRKDQNGSLLNNDSNLVTGELELLRIRVEAVRGEARFVVEALVTWSGSTPAAPAQAQPDADTRSDDPRDFSGSRVQRQGATTAPAEAARLGYPFRFLRLTENRKF